VSRRCDLLPDQRPAAMPATRHLPAFPSFDDPEWLLPPVLPRHRSLLSGGGRACYQETTPAFAGSNLATDIATDTG